MSYTLFAPSAIGSIDAYLKLPSAGDAIKSVISDPDASSGLSPFSQLGVGALQKAAGSVGITLDNVVSGVSSQIVDAITSQIGASVGASIDASIIPIIGQAIQIIAGGIQATEAHNEYIKNQQQQWGKTACDIILNRKPIPTGSALGGGCVLCPANLFVPSVTSSGTIQRPYIGDFLMRITEGGWIDPIDFKLIDPKTTESSTWNSIIDTGYDLMRIGYTIGADKIPKGFSVPTSVLSSISVGVPKSQRILFRKLRRAMEVQGGNSPPTGSDGGALLWPIYLDLLLSEVDSGRLPINFAKYLVNHSYSDQQQFIVDTVQNDTLRSCQSAIVDQIYGDIIDNWRNTVKPKYESGQIALKNAQDALSCINEKGKWNQQTNSCDKSLSQSISTSALASALSKVNTASVASILSKTSPDIKAAALKSTTAALSKPSTSSAGWILGGLAATAAVAGGGYYLYKKRSKK